VEVDKTLNIKERNLREKELQKGQLDELQRTLLAERYVVIGSPPVLNAFCYMDCGNQDPAQGVTC
jgi:hypothetical protein